MLSLFSLKSEGGEEKEPQFFHPNWLKELTEVGYMICRSVSVIDNFGRLIEFGRLMAQP